ncbi:MAG: hypothetical protein HY253_00665 [Burkholderiales bacterium]|nr:hypothetical protein [Burkholderiales bacterium]
MVNQVNQGMGAILQEFSGHRFFASGKVAAFAAFFDGEHDFYVSIRQG